MNNGSCGNSFKYRWQGSQSVKYTLQSFSDLNTVRILYLVLLTSHTRACARTCAISDVRWDQKVPFLRQEFYCIPYEALKEGTRKVLNVLRFVRERAYFRVYRRFTGSIICERVFASLVRGPSRGAFFSRRREVESCRSKCGKRPALLADLCDPLYGKKGTNPPFLDLEMRVLSLGCWEKFDCFWWMHFSSRVLLRTLP